MGAVRHQAADLAEVAGGGEPPVDHDQHVLGEALDLLEDVRGEEDRAALGGPAPQHLHHLETLARVGAVEGLVEDQHIRVVDERGGDLGALAHALRVAAHRPILGVLQLDEGDCPPGGFLGIGKPVQAGAGEGEVRAPRRKG